MMTTENMLAAILMTTQILTAQSYETTDLVTSDYNKLQSLEDAGGD